MKIPKAKAPPEEPEQPKIYTPNDNEIMDARKRATRKASQRGGRQSTKVAKPSGAYSRRMLGG